MRAAHHARALCCSCQDYRMPCAHVLWRSSYTSSRLPFLAFADDDFYMDVTAAVMALGHTGSTETDTSTAVAAADSSNPPPSTHVVGGGVWADVGDALRRGVQLAHCIRGAMLHRLHMTLSVGVASNKLLSRLAGERK